MLPDPIHRRHNAYKGAIKNSGLQPVFVEGSVVVGLRKGPYSGAAFLNVLQETARSLQGSSGPDDPLFEFCYDVILHDLKAGNVLKRHHDPTVKSEIWEQAVRAHIFEQKGSRSKPSRWFSWAEQMQELLPHLGSLTYVLMRIGIERGWCRSVADTPLGRSGLLRSAAGT